MKTKKIKNFSISILTLLIAFGFNISIASAEFDPNYIISDTEILDYDCMSLKEIEDFLNAKGGFLANYSTTDPDGKKITAAEIIYTRAQENKISPKFIITLLQKEMSLIEDKDPKQTQLDWATGYGCPDGAGCNTRWKGLWKQVNSATLQFYDYIDNPQDYNYKKGNTYEFDNPYSTTVKETVSVTPLNHATAGLYNYTPHVYNGNYNFYNIWQRYFTTTYPNGTLLQAKGDVGVWLIQSGKKRPFHSKGALTSRFDINKIIQVEKSDLDSYPTGQAIKFANYSIVRSPMGKLFLLVDDKKRQFESDEAFKKIGFNPEEIIKAEWTDIETYKEGAPITLNSVYPTGALLQNNKTGGVYWISDDKKAPLIDRAFLTHKFSNKKIIAVDPEELDRYETTDPIMFGDGELLTSDNTPTVYLIENNLKRTFTSGEIFEKLGYQWNNIITVSPQLLAKYATGENISSK